MADILIKGMELPKEGHYFLEVFYDGEIRRCSNPLEGFSNTEATAIELPPHGRLVDADVLPIVGITDYKLEGHTVIEYEDLQNAPTVVEASK